MDRKSKSKNAIVFVLMIAGILFSSFISAETTINPHNDKTGTTDPAVGTISENTSIKATEKVAPPDATQTTPTDKQDSAFPYLERALIVATIVNFLVILFGLAMYLVKRRMQQFIPRPITRLEQNS